MKWQWTYGTTHAYTNPIVVYFSSARGDVYTMVRQAEWCYSGTPMYCLKCYQQETCPI